MLAYYGPEWESLASRIIDRWTPSVTGNTGLQLPSTMGRNHGTLTNFANNGNDAYVASPDRLALNFDGSNDYVTGSGSSQQIRAWSFWLKPNSTVNASSAFQTVLQTRLGTNLSWYISLGAATGLLTNEYVTIVDTSGGVNYRAGVADGGSLPSTDWSHLAIVESVSTHAIYVNGVSKSVTLNSTSPGTPIFNGLRLGCTDQDGGGPRGFFAGQLDDIIVSNQALTASEVRFIYEQGRGGGLLMQPPRRRSYYAQLAAAFSILAECGSYALTGQSIPLLYGRVLPADTGSVLLSGQTTPLHTSRLLNADQGSYAYAGTDAATLLGRLLDAGAAAYTLDGTPAGFLASRRISADTVAYLASGLDTGFLRSRVLEAGTGQYVLVASPVNIQTGTGGAAPYYYLFLLGGSR